MLPLAARGAVLIAAAVASLASEDEPGLCAAYPISASGFGGTNQRLARPASCLQASGTAVPARRHAIARAGSGPSPWPGTEAEEQEDEAEHAEEQGLREAVAGASTAARRLHRLAEILKASVAARAVARPHGRVAPQAQAAVASPQRSPGAKLFGDRQRGGHDSGSPPPTPVQPPSAAPVGVGVSSGSAPWLMGVGGRHEALADVLAGVRTPSFSTPLPWFLVAFFFLCLGLLSWQFCWDRRRQRSQGDLADDEHHEAWVFLRASDLPESDALSSSSAEERRGPAARGKQQQGARSAAGKGALGKGGRGPRPYGTTRPAAGRAAASSSNAGHDILGTLQTEFAEERAVLATSGAIIQATGEVAKDVAETGFLGVVRGAQVAAHAGQQGAGQVHNVGRRALKKVKKVTEDAQDRLETAYLESLPQASSIRQ